MEEHAIVEVKDIKKYFGETHAVDGISFSVDEGEIFGILGPNGAGKSTTIEMLVGIQKRLSGEIKVLGFDPQTNAKQLKECIGVQLQNVRLFNKVTIKELLKLFHSFYKNPRDVDQVIEQFQLSEKKNSYIGQLSGGQLQRVSIALAMISNGKVIFLDEPTAGLDPQARQQLWEVIREIQKEGCTVLLTTHYMEEAEHLCDRVAIIDYGKIVAMGSPNELIEEYFKESSIQLENKDLESYPELYELTNVREVVVSNGTITIYTQNVAAAIEELMTLCKEKGINLTDFRVRQGNLEDVFLKLTGRGIRE